GLEGLKDLGDVFTADWKIEVPDVPEIEKMPMWPFSKDHPNVQWGGSKKNFSFNSDDTYTFSKEEYKKDKQGYVNKLNKKYGSNATVKQTDRWLDDLDAWSEKLEKSMEKWGEKFGKSFEQNFGPDFEKRMEEWGENFGKSFEENFGPEFEKRMQEWGENFGKKMEAWGAQFEKDAEKWAEKYDGDYTKEEIVDENGNRTTIIRSGTNAKKSTNKKAKKTIIIRMPKNTKTDINVRHGEIKMADVTNVRATLNYAALTANSIDGGKTLINASYAPIEVNYWGNGVLAVQYVDSCTLNSVDTINLSSNSSNVVINELKKDAYIKGFIGSLFINKIGSNFSSIDIVLDDTNASLVLPSSEYTFYFNGRKSTLQYPKSLQASHRKEYGRVLVNGFNKNRNAQRSLTVNANYSNVKIK
ncbi:MAG: hypothetical protein R3359_06710, partial [Marinirhabdus sp.]|nr:hypothetical protein [Marinirhabdus sp.]